MVVEIVQALSDNASVHSWHMMLYGQRKQSDQLFTETANIFKINIGRKFVAKEVNGLHLWTETRWLMENDELRSIEKYIAWLLRSQWSLLLYADKILL